MKTDVSVIKALWACGYTLYSIIILYEQQSEYSATSTGGKFHRDKEKGSKEKQNILKVEKHINSIMHLRTCILPFRTLGTAPTKIKDKV